MTDVICLIWRCKKANLSPNFNNTGDATNYATKTSKTVLFFLAFFHQQFFYYCKHRHTFLYSNQQSNKQTKFDWIFLSTCLKKTKQKELQIHVLIISAAREKKQKTCFLKAITATFFLSERMNLLPGVLVNNTIYICEKRDLVVIHSPCKKSLLQLVFRLQVYYIHTHTHIVSLIKTTIYDDTNKNSNDVPIFWSKTLYTL